MRLAGTKKKGPGTGLPFRARCYRCSSNKGGGRVRTPADIVGHRSNSLCTVTYISRNIFPLLQAQDARILRVRGGVPGGPGPFFNCCRYGSVQNRCGIWRFNPACLSLKKRRRRPRAAQLLRMFSCLQEHTGDERIAER